MEWREITQVNVETVKELYNRGHLIIVAAKNSAGVQYAEKSRFHESFDMMARDGGYYYMWLPKLY